MVCPGVGHGAGFSALRFQGNAVKGEDSLKGFSLGVVNQEALVRPEEGHAWRSGFLALAPALKMDSAAQGAIVAPEMAAHSTGFAALKAAAAKGGAPALGGASALQEPSGHAMQRPAGTEWSDGFQNLRK